MLVFTTATYHAGGTTGSAASRATVHGAREELNAASGRRPRSPATLDITGNQKCFSRPRNWRDRSGIVRSAATGYGATAARAAARKKHADPEICGRERRRIIYSVADHRDQSLCML